MTTPADAPLIAEDVEVPTGLDHPSFRLRVLGPEHNERDHRAWMGSIEHIRTTPGYPDGSWPSPMSLDDNLRDLERHRSDFDARAGFTYTVLSPEGAEDGADVIGCVYVYPDRETEAVVQVQSWVTAEHADLDALLATTVRAWLESDAWPWSPDEVRDHPREAVR